MIHAIAHYLIQKLKKERIKKKKIGMMNLSECMIFLLKDRRKGIFYADYYDVPNAYNVIVFGNASFHLLSCVEINKILLLFSNVLS